MKTVGTASTRVGLDTSFFRQRLSDVPSISSGKNFAKVCPIDGDGRIDRGKTSAKIDLRSPYHLFYVVVLAAARLGKDYGEPLFGQNRPGREEDNV